MSASRLHDVLVARDGLSQRGRALPALDPRSAPVDGRTGADWLRYLAMLAPHLRSFDANNQQAGDWLAFLESDVSVLLAQSLDSHQAERLAEAQRCADSVCTSGDKDGLFRLFDSLFAEIVRLDRSAALIASERLGVADLVQNRVVPRLKTDLRTLIGLYKTATEAFAPNLSPAAERAREAGLRRLWSEAGPPATVEQSQACWNQVPRNDAILPGTADPKAKVIAIAEYARMLLAPLSSAMAEVAAAAARDFGKTLQDWPTHQPHMALMLAFVLLFDVAVEELNALTGRHLDYTFKQVLRLAHRPAKPDRACVVFELAKPRESAALVRGTELLAGKDAEGKEVRYALVDDLRVTHATATRFMAVNVTPPRKGEPGRDDALVLRAAPVASSADGKGAPLAADTPYWPPFGTTSCDPADLGLYLASPLFDLREGTRTMTLTFKRAGARPIRPIAIRPSREKVLPAEAGLEGRTGRLDLLGMEKLQAARPGQDWTDRVRVSLTTAKAWLDATMVSASLSESELKIVVKLDAKAPATAPYNAAHHGGALPITRPVCRIVIEQREDADWNYGLLSRLSFSGVTIGVNVTGMRSLAVETELGPVESTKPFMPFGAQPENGSRCYVSCPELAGKAASFLELQLGWKNLPVDQEGQKQALGTYFAEYANVHGGTDFKCQVAGGPSLEELRGARAWTADSVPFDAGFSKASPKSLPAGTACVGLELVAPSYGFGFRQYAHLQVTTAVRISQAIAASSRDTGLGEPQELERLPNPPFAPVLSSLSLDYRASSSLTLPAAPAAPDIEIFHLHPFGAASIDRSRSALTLVPQYIEPDGAAFAAQLHVGIEKLKPDERLSLLFLLAEGMADPLLPAGDVKWCYVDGAGALKPLSPQAIEDGTQGLIQSGIVRVMLPREAFVASPRLPSGITWLVASSVWGRSVASVRSVRTQAAVAELLSPQEHASLLSAALPAGSITAVATRPPAIKKVEQPAPSFDGRAPESDSMFRQRVSERLRHKHRAISVHDYESLVLEEFPSLYKVKCLLHTSPGADRDDELAPGCVTIVALPRVSRGENATPFAPYASQSLMAKVRQFLTPLVGGFVDVQVVNPRFERIALSFSLGAREGEDWQLCRDRLNAEINAFLCPWAFAEGQDVAFGGKIHRSTLIQLADSRPYVDYVTDFRMFALDGPDPASDLEVVTATRSRSILVSAGEHNISPARPPGQGAGK